MGTVQNGMSCPLQCSTVVCTLRVLARHGAPRRSAPTWPLARDTPGRSDAASALTAASMLARVGFTGVSSVNRVALNPQLCGTPRTLCTCSMQPYSWCPLARQLTPKSSAWRESAAPTAPAGAAASALPLQAPASVAWPQLPLLLPLAVGTGLTGALRPRRARRRARVRPHCRAR
jgi:hypothetical protein